MDVKQELVEQCFMHFYGLDVSNAAIHCASPRFSPITFRLQEALDDVDHQGMVSDQAVERTYAWQHVRRHNGAYAEDPGR